MPGETALFLVRLVGFAGFLWLGLYVVTRGDRGHVATLFGLTALATAGFFLSVGLAAINFGVLAMRVSHTAGRIGASLVAAGSAASGAADEDAIGTQVRGVEVRLLAGGALFFLLGAGYIAVNILLRYPWSQ